MAYIGKTYSHDKDENFSEFLAVLGIPADRVDDLLKSKPSQQLQKDGDTYNLITTGYRGTKELKFQDGVEFDEEVVPGIVAKTTFNVSGDVVTQTQKFDDGRVLTITRTYSGNNLDVTIKASSWDGEAYRHYVAA